MPVNKSILHYTLCKNLLIALEAEGDKIIRLIQINKTNPTHITRPKNIGAYRCANKHLDATFHLT